MAHLSRDRELTFGGDDVGEPLVRGLRGGRAVVGGRLVADGLQHRGVGAPADLAPVLRVVVCQHQQLAVHRVCRRGRRGKYKVKSSLLRLGTLMGHQLPHDQ